MIRAEGSSRKLNWKTFLIARRFRSQRIIAQSVSLMWSCLLKEYQSYGLMMTRTLNSTSSTSTRGLVQLPKSTNKKNFAVGFVTFFELKWNKMIYCIFLLQINKRRYKCFVEIERMEMYSEYVIECLNLVLNQLATLSQYPDPFSTRFLIFQTHNGCYQVFKVFIQKSSQMQTTSVDVLQATNIPTLPNPTRD